jgi:hypothetical protein
LVEREDFKIPKKKRRTTIAQQHQTASREGGHIITSLWDKVRTMFHSASGRALDAIRADLKQRQPIRVFGVFDEMPADGERKSKQIFRIIGKRLPREQATEEMQEPA